MNLYDDNTGGWKDCVMRSWLNDDFFRLLPEELSSNIVTVEKLTNNDGCMDKEGDGTGSITATADAIWLPSLTELYGVIPDSWRWSIVYNAEGTQYQLYSEAGG